MCQRGRGHATGLLWRKNRWKVCEAKASSLQLVYHQSSQRQAVRVMANQFAHYLQLLRQRLHAMDQNCGEASHETHRFAAPASVETPRARSVSGPSRQQCDMPNVWILQCSMDSVGTVWISPGNT